MSKLETMNTVLIWIACTLISVAVIYATVIYAIRFYDAHHESKKAQLKLEEIIRRYFINVMNSFDLDSKMVKDDKGAKLKYISELNSILKEFDVLSKEPYYSRMITKYPLLQTVIMNTQIEIIESGFQDTRSLNISTIAEYYKLYHILHNELLKAGHPEIDQNIGKIVDILELEDKLT